MKTVVVCDANSLWARAYFGAARVNGSVLHSAWRSWMAVLNHCRPTHAVLCWDGQSKTVKRRTSEKPANFFDGVDAFAELLDKLGVPSVQSQEHEADDLVASYALNLPEGFEAVVVSGDRDLEQLWRDNIRIYSLNKKGFVSREAICSSWGILDPRHIAVVMAIVGDPGDGIAGVKGWGQAKATKLFERVTEAMTLVEVVDHIDSLIVRDDHREQFLTSLEATVLHPDAPGIQTKRFGEVQWIGQGALADVTPETFLATWKLEDTADQYRHTFLVQSDD